MLRTLTIVSAMSLLLTPALGQQTPSSDCFMQWKNADADRNGVIDKGEAGGQAQGLARDAFLADCVKGAKLLEQPGQPSQAGICLLYTSPPTITWPVNARFSRRSLTGLFAV